MSETQCSVCHGSFPETQIFFLNERAICANCKSVVLERVKSGEPDPVEPESLDTRLLGFFALLGTSWRVIRSEWPRLLGMALVVSIPVNILIHLIPYPEEPSLEDFADFVRAVQFLEAMIGTLAVLGISWITRERLEGRPATLGRAVVHSLKRWLASVGTYWLEAIFLIFLLLLLVVPGLIFLGYYTFSQLAVSLRGQAGTGALSYSKELVTGRWWRVVLVALAVNLPVLGVVFGVGYASGYFGVPTPVEYAVDVVSDLLMAPVTVFMTVFFLNLDYCTRPGRAVPELPTAAR